MLPENYKIIDAGLITLFFLAMCVVGYIIWKILKFYYGKYAPVEYKINNAPCQKNEDYYKQFRYVYNTVQDIHNYILKKDPKAITEFKRKCCPYQLTEKGIVLLENSGGKKCIDENFTFFIDEIIKQNPKVALDVEDESLYVLSNNTSEDFFNDIKNFIYNAPCPYKAISDNGQELIIEDPIEINHVIHVMGVYLRDKFLELYPQYNTGIVENKIN